MWVQARNNPAQLLLAPLRECALYFNSKKKKRKENANVSPCMCASVCACWWLNFSPFRVRSHPPTHTHTHTHSHLVVWELRDAWPCGLCWGAKDPEDAKELVNLRVTREKGACGDHLGKDAANRPHVNGARVLTGAKQHLWRTVPKCHNLSPS